MFLHFISVLVCSRNSLNGLMMLFCLFDQGSLHFRAVAFQIAILGFHWGIALIKFSLFLKQLHPLIFHSRF